MVWDDKATTLYDTLVYLYGGRGANALKIVATRTGINLALINFDQPSQNALFEVVDLTIKTTNLDDLISAAEKDFKTIRDLYQKNLRKEGVRTDTPDELIKALAPLLQEFGFLNQKVLELKQLHHSYNSAIGYFGPVAQEIKRTEAVNGWENLDLIIGHWKDMEEWKNALLKAAKEQVFLIDPNLTPTELMETSRAWVDRAINFYLGLDSLIKRVGINQDIATWRSFKDLASEFNSYLISTLTDIDEQLKAAIDEQHLYSKRTLEVIAR